MVVAQREGLQPGACAQAAAQASQIFQAKVQLTYDAQVTQACRRLYQARCKLHT